MKLLRLRGTAVGIVGADGVAAGPDDLWFFRMDPRSG